MFELHFRVEMTFYSKDKKIKHTTKSKWAALTLITAVNDAKTSLFLTNQTQYI